MYTIAEEMLLFQQHHNVQETVQEVMRLVAIEDILSTHNSGMYSAICTFIDGSQLYVEEDVYYKANDNINYR